MAKVSAVSVEKPRTLRAEQRAYTQRRLTEAGLQVFHEHGYTQASIDQVVTAAGASRATFYLHFKSKAQLMERVITARQSDLMGTYDRFAEIHSRSQLREWLSDVLAFASADRGRYINVLSQAALAEKSIARMQDKIFDDYTDAIMAGRSLSPRQEERARVRVRLLILQLERLIFMWLVRGWNPEHEELVDALTDSWVGMLPDSFFSDA